MRGCGPPARNAAANWPIDHEIGRGEAADLTAVAPLAREGPPIEGGRGVQDGDLGVDDLAAVVGGRAHPVDLLLHRRNDLIVARQREEFPVSRQQERNTVVRKQRSGVALASATSRKDIEILSEPPAHVAAVHDHGPYRRREHLEYTGRRATLVPHSCHARSASKIRSGDSLVPRLWPLGAPACPLHAQLADPAAAGGAHRQSSPENRSQAACFDTPSACPMRVQLRPRSRKMATWSWTAASACETTA
jgi:hypothetical protein